MLDLISLVIGVRRSSLVWTSLEGSPRLMLLSSRSVSKLFSYAYTVTLPLSQYLQYSSLRVKFDLDNERSVVFQVGKVPSEHLRHLGDMNNLKASRPRSPVRRADPPISLATLLAWRFSISISTTLILILDIRALQACKIFFFFNFFLEG